MSDFTPNQSSQAQRETRAEVVYNSNSEAQEAFVGMTISQIRVARASIWGIPTNARAYRGTESLDENYVLSPGDRIEFIRTQGDKG